MEIEYQREETVPQNLVVAILIALIHSKPILITSGFHLRQIEAQIVRVGVVLTGMNESDYHTINCGPELQWSTFESSLVRYHGNVVVMKRIEQSSQDFQLQLGYALMQPNSDMKQFFGSSALVFTSRSLPEKMHPFLRRQILLKQDLDLIDEDYSLVALPDVQDSFNSSTQSYRIRQAIPTVTIVPELLRYMQDILMYVRAHRFARGGIPPRAAADFELVVRTLCVLEDKGYATPSVIRYAARLTLPMHVRLCTPEDEPSLQYGGDISVVKAWIKEWDGDVLVDSVLDNVPVPG